MIVDTPFEPPQNIEDQPSRCRYCTEASVDFCKHCGQEFCVNHRSRYNSLVCMSCVSDTNLTVESQPLAEEDGTTHKGRRLKLIGEGWPNSVQMLKNLTDEELDAHIGELTLQLKEAQISLDYSKILLAAAEFQKEHTKWSRAIAAKKRREKIEQGSIRLNNKSVRASGPKSVDSAVALAKTLNCTVDEARAVMTMLGK